MKDFSIITKTLVWSAILLFTGLTFLSCKKDPKIEDPMPCVELYKVDPNTQKLILIGGSGQTVTIRSEDRVVFKFCGTADKAVVYPKGPAYEKLDISTNPASFYDYTTSGPTVPEGYPVDLLVTNTSHSRSGKTKTINFPAVMRVHVDKKLQQASDVYLIFDKGTPNAVTTNAEIITVYKGDKYIFEPAVSGRTTGYINFTSLSEVKPTLDIVNGVKDSINSRLIIYNGPTVRQSRVLNSFGKITRDTFTFKELGQTSIKFEQVSTATSIVESVSKVFIFDVKPPKAKFNINFWDKDIINNPTQPAKTYEFSTTGTLINLRNPAYFTTTDPNLNAITFTVDGPGKIIDDTLLLATSLGNIVLTVTQTASSASFSTAIEKKSFNIRFKGTTPLEFVSDPTQRKYLTTNGSIGKGALLTSSNLKSYSSGAITYKVISSNGTSVENNPVRVSGDLTPATTVDIRATVAADLNFLESTTIITGVKILEGLPVLTFTKPSSKEILKGYRSLSPTPSKTIELQAISDLPSTGAITYSILPTTIPSAKAGTAEIFNLNGAWLTGTGWIKIKATIAPDATNGYAGTSKEIDFEILDPL